MAKPPHTSSEAEPHAAGSIFDEQNRTVEEFGVFGEEYRPW